MLATLPGPLCLLSSLSVHEAPFHCPFQAPPTATIAFNAAATNAIAAASNVTANINTAVMQLQDQARHPLSVRRPCSIFSSLSAASIAAS